MKKKGIITLLALSLTTIVLVSCGGRKNDDPNLIRVGVQTGPEFVVAQEAQRVAKEKYGLNVELIEFNDYVMPNTALEQGDIDVNAFQHKQFLEDQIKQRGYDFSVVGNTFIYPIAAYSNKIKSKEELKDGSTIVIPNDATNGGRALLLLAKQGLIQLKDGIGNTPTLVDIVSNPRGFKILELEAPQLPRMLDDAGVTIAVINNTFAGQAGLSVKDGLFREDSDSPYVNIIVARTDNKDAEKVKKFVQAYQTPEVEEVAKREFKGDVIRGW